MKYITSVCPLESWICYFLAFSLPWILGPLLLAAVPQNLLNPFTRFILFFSPTVIFAVCGVLAQKRPRN